MHSPGVSMTDGDHEYDDDCSSAVSSVTGFPGGDDVGFNLENGVSTGRENKVVATGICSGGGDRGGRRGEDGAEAKAMIAGPEKSLPIERQMASKVNRSSPSSPFVFG